jgi:hypothetical protein
MNKDLKDSDIIGETPVSSMVFEMVERHHREGYTIGGQQLPSDTITFNALDKFSGEHWQLKINPFLATHCGKAMISVVGIDCYGEHFVCIWKWNIKSGGPNTKVGNLRKLTEGEKCAYRMLTDPIWIFEPKSG